MCGGILEQIPCSRVGHIYRTNAPYTYPEGQGVLVRTRNKRRLAVVWLDNWIKLAEAAFPSMYYRDG